MFSARIESKEFVPDFSGASPGQYCFLHAEHFVICHFAKRVVQWYFCLNEESLIKPLFENQTLFSVATTHLDSHEIIPCYLPLPTKLSHEAISEYFFFFFFRGLPCKYTELTSKVLTVTVFVLQSSLVNRHHAGFPE